MEQQLVSAIIPVYDAEMYINAALESIFAQTYRPLEVIVIDDGSTDKTPSIVQAWKDVRYIRQENSGESVARNNAITAARGDFIAFLDADDIWTPDKIGKQIQLLQEHPEYGAAICHVKFFLEPNQPIPDGFRPELLKHDTIGRLPSALVARRSVFDTVGVFDPTLTTSQDVDWFARANDAGIRIGIVPETLLLKRVHGTNASTTGPTKNLLTALRRSVTRKHSGPQ